MTTVNIWISSVCTSEDAFIYLLESIKSALSLSLNIKLATSVYFDNVENAQNRLTSFIKSYPNPSTILFQVQSCRQFEHIEKLMQTENLSDNDWVIFLDDDDLLLKNALDILQSEEGSHINGYVGYQILSQSEQMNVATLQEISEYIYLQEVRTDPTVVEFIDDFSGTSIRYKYLKDYFAKIHPTISIFHKQVEDTCLMSFLEKNVPDTLILKSDRAKEPFVFHRLKQSSGLWMQNWFSDIEQGLRDTFIQLDNANAKSSEI